jgi:hypothetical protein
MRVDERPQVDAGTVARTVGPTAAPDHAKTARSSRTIV